MTTDQDSATITAQELLDQLVEEGHDADLVVAGIEEYAAVGVVPSPADSSAPLVLSDRAAALVRAHVEQATVLRSAPTPPPACPSWCGLEPGHGFVETLTETGRPCRSHVLETSRGDESIDLVADETVEVDGTVTVSAPYLVVWVGGNPVEQNMTGPEVLALLRRLNDAASAAVSAYDQAVGA